MDVLEVRWFQSTDMPIRDETPFKTVSQLGKVPTNWLAFSHFDSRVIEELYQGCKADPSLPPTCLPVGADGLFEVNVKTKELYPIYWSGATHLVRRGVWFEPKGSIYVPVEDNLTTQVEDGFSKYLINKDKDVVERWHLLGPYINQFVTFASPTVAFVQTDELSSILQRAVLKNSGTRLVRGWSNVENLKGKLIKKKSDLEEGLDAAAAAAATSPIVIEAEKEIIRPIDHLILVIHGIGQKLSQHVEAMSFINDCDMLRNGLNEAKKQFDGNTKEKVPEVACGIQVIPIQWRHLLDLKIPTLPEDSDDESAAGHLTLEDITPEGISGIRTLISDVIFDVMMYLTPRLRNEMITYVSNELNRVYSLYKKRNPDTEIKVSIYGHSLGSVIGYDIAAHQHSLDIAKSRQSSMGPLAFEMDISDMLFGKDPAPKQVEDRVSKITAPKLDFEINHLFTVGSPVGIFLLLSGKCIRPTASVAQHHLDPKVSRPAVNALYNIYHAFDPVAHRIEPLFSNRFNSLRPMSIHYTKGGFTQTVMSVGKSGTEALERGRTLLSGLYSSAGNMMSSLTKIVPSTTEADLNVSEENIADSSVNKSPERSTIPLKDAESAPGRNTAATKLEDLDKKASGIRRLLMQSEPSKTQLSAMEKLKKLNKHGRLDFVLQQTVLENPYISSLAVHMCYWQDQDVNGLIYRALYDL